MTLETLDLQSHISDLLPFSHPLITGDSRFVLALTFLAALYATRTRRPADRSAVREPFVKSNKNDFIDAEAIAEALERKNMRFVAIKCQLPPRVIDEAFTACGRVRQPAI